MHYSILDNPDSDQTAKDENSTVFKVLGISGLVAARPDTSSRSADESKH